MKRSLKIAEYAVMLLLCLCAGFIAEKAVKLLGLELTPMPNRDIYYILGGIGFFFTMNAYNPDKSRSKMAPWREKWHDHLISGSGIFAAFTAGALGAMYICSAIITAKLPALAGEANSQLMTGLKIKMLDNLLWVYLIFLAYSFFVYLLYRTWYKVPFDSFAYDKTTGHYLLAGEKYRIFWPFDLKKYSILPLEQEVMLGRFWIKCKDVDMAADYGVRIRLAFQESDKRELRHIDIDLLFRDARILISRMLEMHALTMTAAQLQVDPLTLPNPWQNQRVISYTIEERLIINNPEYSRLDALKQ